MLEVFNSVLKGVRSLPFTALLGLAGYYRRFIKDFSRLAAPMTRLIRKEVKFEWNDLCEKAF